MKLSEPLFPLGDPEPIQPRSRCASVQCTFRTGTPLSRRRDDPLQSPSMPKRVTKQQQQEQISRAQISEHLRAFGWIVDEFQNDLGEDLLVRIYDHGVSSGLSFPVQLKSTAGLEETCADMPYDVKVKDLKHWLPAIPFVVFIVWNVKTRQGGWIPIPDAVRGVEHTNPKWREQKTVRINLPVGNDLSSQGLTALRHALATAVLPLVPKGPVALRLKVAFPVADEGGKTAFAAWTRALATGESCTIDGKYVESLKYSPWWTQLFGDQQLPVHSLRVETAPSNASFPIALTARSSDGRQVRVDYIELRPVRAGTEETTLTNEHLPHPLLVTLVVRRNQAGTISLKETGVGRTTKEAFELFALAELLHAGCDVTLVRLTDRHEIPGAVPPGTWPLPMAEVGQFLRWLLAIEAKTGANFDLEKHWPPTEDDLRAVQDLGSILFTGSVECPACTVTMTVNARELRASIDAVTKSAGHPLTWTYQDASRTILGSVVKLGSIHHEVLLPNEQLLEAMRSSLGSAADHEDVVLTIPATGVRERYVDWKLG